jgi:hypothetical protein
MSALGAYLYQRLLCYSHAVGGSASPRAMVSVYRSGAAQNILLQGSINSLGDAFPREAPALRLR